MDMAFHKIYRMYQIEMNI